MAKKLINRIADKFRKMNEENKNNVTDENTTNANPLADEQPATDEQQPADNIAEPATDDWEAKYNEANDKYLRLYSEFDNFRRRSARERIDLVATAGSDVIKALLPVVDDFERALKNLEDNAENAATREGILLIYNKMKHTLQGKGLEEMKTLGEAFDADLHEALTQIPAPSDDLKGKVVDELEKGYYLHGKVIRYAKVVVGS
jgi:molecular chaperone GrpE